MVPSFDAVSIAEHLRAASAEVRLAPVRGEDASLAAEGLERYLKGIASSRDGFLELANRITVQTKETVEIDRYLTETERESLRRVDQLLREWAPKFANLRAPEADPFVRTFPTWFRSYNDANTKLVRAMIDCAGLLQERLADEYAEDAKADEWAARYEPLAGDEETVSLDELERRSAALSS